MIRTMLAALVLTLTLVMSACGIQSGYIQDKEYTEPYTTQKKVYRTDCRPAVRTVTVYVDGKPQQRLENYQDCQRVWTGQYKDVYHEAEWHFELRNDEGDEGRVEVEKTDYDNYEIGDYFDAEDNS